MPEPPARWSAFLPVACANTKNCVNAASPTRHPDGRRAPGHARQFSAGMDVIETHLSFLASVGSVSPYVGLFGTVWGIMHAFTGLASLQQVTLATVAPGIAEALVATAIGLFAAIPPSSPTTGLPAILTGWPSGWRPSSKSFRIFCNAM
jgi:hypothetical protein